MLLPGDRNLFIHVANFCWYLYNMALEAFVRAAAGCYPGVTQEEIYGITCVPPYGNPSFMYTLV